MIGSCTIIFLAPEAGSGGPVFALHKATTNWYVNSRNDAGDVHESDFLGLDYGKGNATSHV
jgi:hypothetical protein